MVPETLVRIITEMNQELPWGILTPHVQQQQGF